MLQPVENPNLVLPSSSRYSSLFDPKSPPFATAESLSLSLPTAMSYAVDKRVAEFLAGRICASQALSALGLEGPHYLPISPNRAPSWPQGYIGSITHCGNFASAAVAPRSQVAGIGIDSELILTAATVLEIKKMIVSAAELEKLRSTVGLDECQLMTLVFSAKESIFKCLNPLTETFFDFLDAEISTISVETGSFEFWLLTRLSSRFNVGFSGKGSFDMSGQYVHTAFIVNA